MSNASQLIADQYRNGQLVKRGFGDAFYIVTAYGIFGDGITNVTSKLQELVNQAKSVGRSAIFFPKGNYYVTGLTNTTGLYFFGDNAHFVGGYNGEITQIGSPPKNNIVTNVKDYGAKGDGVTDDSPAFVAAISAISSTGGTIFIPGGKYKFGSQVSINLSTVNQTSGNGINIRGDNPNTTILLNATTSDYIFYAYSSDPSYAVNYFRMSGVTFTRFGSITTNHGLRLLGLCNAKISDCSFDTLNVGLNMNDTLSLGIYDCRFNGNLKGLIAGGQINLSSPNAIDIHTCTFYGNGVYAAFFDEGCNVNFFGGSIETNGHRVDLTENRYGVKLNGLGRYGSGGATFVGVYFEVNQDIADVWINHGNYPAAYSFIGCSFNRVEPKFSQHNIRLDASNTSPTTSAKLFVSGCGFRTFAGYIPDAGRRVIQFYGAGISVFEQSGNYYNNQEDLPGPTSNRVFAHGRFTGLSTTPLLYRGFNVSTITRNGTGDYTINFIFPSVINQKVTTVSMDQIGFTQVISETTSSIRVKCWQKDGVTAVDPSFLTFQSFE